MNHTEFGKRSKVNRDHADARRAPVQPEFPCCEDDDSDDETADARAEVEDVIRRE